MKFSFNQILLGASLVGAGLLLNACGDVGYAEVDGGDYYGPDYYVGGVYYGHPGYHGNDYVAHPPHRDWHGGGGHGGGRPGPRPGGGGGGGHPAPAPRPSGGGGGQRTTPEPHNQRGRGQAGEARLFVIPGQRDFEAAMAPHLEGLEDLAGV